MEYTVHTYRAWPCVEENAMSSICPWCKEPVEHGRSYRGESYHALCLQELLGEPEMLGCDDPLDRAAHEEQELGLRWEDER